MVYGAKPLPNSPRPPPSSMIQCLVKFNFAERLLLNEHFNLILVKDILLNFTQIRIRYYLTDMR